MSIHWLRLLAIVSLGFFTSAALLTDAVFPGDKKQQRYTILPSSKLLLKGTTNVNNFTCKCEDRFSAQVLEAEASGGKQTRFRNARLRMTTRKFNCQNAKMERDLCKALKASEYPYIQVELLETQHDPEHFKNGAAGRWADVRAKVKLTITGVSKEQIIDARAKTNGPNSFSLQGEKSLNMSEYGIDPPEALFGLIKVDDLITFQFYLDIAVEEAGAPVE